MHVKRYLGSIGLNRGGWPLSFPSYQRNIANRVGEYFDGISISAVSQNSLRQEKRLKENPELSKTMVKLKESILSKCRPDTHSLDPTPISRVSVMGLGLLA